MFVLVSVIMTQAHSRGYRKSQLWSAIERSMLKSTSGLIFPYRQRGRSCPVGHTMEHSSSQCHSEDQFLALAPLTIFDDSNSSMMITFGTRLTLMM